MPARLLAIVALAAVGIARAGDPVADPLDAAAWITRCPDADRLLADPAAIARLNRRILDLDSSVTDLAALPATLDQAAVVDRVRDRCRVPDGPLVHGDGAVVGDDARRRWIEALAIDAVPASVPLRFGLVVRRAAVRRFPTRERVHATPRDTDIDQFQETAFFPGTPVAAIHATGDGGWSFVIGPTYDGWVEADAIGFGDRETVLDFAAGATRVVTAARAETATVPGMPEVSQVCLDMGTTLPEIHSGPADDAVPSQSAAASIVVRMPTRTPDGGLRIVPALLPRSAGTHDGPLPATRAAVLRQAFAFLGERYGWGHDFGSRDCSGFVCDVYRSLGIVLPRNTRNQAVCPALDATAVPPDTPRGDRDAMIRALLPGDLVFTRRHVMMIVGRDEHRPWVIHDTHDGRLGGTVANGVVVQPLDSLHAVTAVVRVLPSSPSAETP